MIAAYLDPSRDRLVEARRPASGRARSIGWSGPVCQPGETAASEVAYISSEPGAARTGGRGPHPCDVGTEIRHALRERDAVLVDRAGRVDLQHDDRAVRLSRVQPVVQVRQQRPVDRAFDIHHVHRGGSRGAGRPRPSASSASAARSRAKRRIGVHRTDRRRGVSWAPPWPEPRPPDATRPTRPFTTAGRAYSWHRPSPSRPC